MAVEFGRREAIGLQVRQPVPGIAMARSDFGRAPVRGDGVVCPAIGLQGMTAGYECRWIIRQDAQDTVEISSAVS
jgi:hypothetical protein